MTLQQIRNIRGNYQPVQFTRALKSAHHVSLVSRNLVDEPLCEMVTSTMTLDVGTELMNLRPTLSPYIYVYPHVTQKLTRIQIHCSLSAQLPGSNCENFADRGSYCCWRYFFQISKYIFFRSTVSAQSNILSRYCDDQLHANLVTSEIFQGNHYY